MRTIIRNILISVFVLYLALFGLTKVIRYPEPIATIRLGFAPASKTPDLMPSHIIEGAPSTESAWIIGEQEEIMQVMWQGENVSFQEFLDVLRQMHFS